MNNLQWIKSTNLDHSQQLWWGKTALYRTAAAPQLAEICLSPLALSPLQPRRLRFLCCPPEKENPLSNWRLMHHAWTSLTLLSYVMHLFWRRNHVGRVKEEYVHFPTQLGEKRVSLQEEQHSDMQVVKTPNHKSSWRLPGLWSPAAGTPCYKKQSLLCIVLLQDSHQCNWNINACVHETGCYVLHQ